MAALCFPFPLLGLARVNTRPAGTPDLKNTLHTHRPFLTHPETLRCALGKRPSQRPSLRDEGQKLNTEKEEIEENHPPSSGSWTWKCEGSFEPVRYVPNPSSEMPPFLFLDLVLSSWSPSTAWRPYSCLFLFKTRLLLSGLYSSQLKLLVDKFCKATCSTRWLHFRTPCNSTARSVGAGPSCHADTPSR